MAKVLLVFKVHSFVDVITNSSTELFVCDTEKSLEVVEEILQKILAGYNLAMDKNLAFDEVFCKPSIATKGEIEELHRNYGDYGHYQPIPEGAVLIYGAGDNTIPFSMFDMIEERFGGVDRWHLG